MSFAGSWKEIRVGMLLGMQEIGINTRRSVLSLFSIALGIATVLILNSLTGGAKRQTVESMQRMGGTSLVTVQSVAPANADEEAAFARSAGLTFEEMENFLKGSKYFDALLPEGWSRINTLKGSAGSRQSHAMAVGAVHFAQNNIDITMGSEGDMKSLQTAWERGDKLIVLGDKLAKELFADAQASLGQTVEYAGLKLKVVGMIQGSSSMDWKRNLAYYPYKLYAKELAGPNQKLNEIKIRLKDIRDKENAMLELRGYLLRSHRGVRDFALQTAEEQIAESEKASSALSLLGWLIAIMALGVGGIGILNLMLATVQGRLKEIGVRKALGASDSSVLAQFLVESLLVAGTGTMLGLLLGAAPTWFLADLLPIKPWLRPMDYGLALILGWGTGIFAGIYPALKAARLSPVEALRGG